MILVTGSAGHLGEALMRTLRDAGRDAVGLDIAPSPFTDIVADIADRDAARDAIEGVDAVLHAATLHKPHVATHSRRQFVDTNIIGTLNLLEEAAANRVGAFVFTSTTSAFGAAMTPPEGAPAAWIDESVVPVPKNIYGVTKTAAEDLCALFHRRFGLPAVVLRTSRFFPEIDDDPEIRAAFEDANVKANEFLFRRVEIEDVVSAHLCALDRAGTIGFGKYVVSATTPFRREDAPALRRDAPGVVRARVPRYEEVYAARGWRMFPSIGRVYDNARARRDLGWSPRWDFAAVLDALAEGREPRSGLARAIGAKGYHDEVFEDGPFPVEPAREISPRR